MLGIIKRFKNREFCVDKYAYELHKILMNEGLTWYSGGDYYWKASYKNIGVSDVSDTMLTRDSSIENIVEVEYFIEQYNKELSESLHTDLNNTKSHTMEEFESNKFYLVCNTIEENLKIRELCKKCGLVVRDNYGNFDGHFHHYLCYDKNLIRPSNLKEIYGLFASANGSQKKVSGIEFITKVEKEIGENDMNNFTKDDLVMGKHVVEFKNGESGIYLMNGFNDSLGNPLCSSYCLYPDLTGKFGYDVIKVFEIINTGTNDSIETKINTARLVWERGNKQKQDLQKEIQELLNKATQIKKQIDEM